MLQIAAITTPPPPAPPASGPDERLLHPTAPGDCPTGPSGEIVVCRKKDGGADKYRLPGIGPQADTTILPKAEWKLFGDTKMEVHATQRGLPGGISAPAAMVTIKVPF